MFETTPPQSVSKNITWTCVRTRGETAMAGFQTSGFRFAGSLRNTQNDNSAISRLMPASVGFETLDFKFEIRLIACAESRTQHWQLPGRSRLSCSGNRSGIRGESRGCIRHDVAGRCDRCRAGQLDGVLLSQRWRQPG